MRVLKLDINYLFTRVFVKNYLKDKILKA